MLSFLRVAVAMVSHGNKTLRQKGCTKIQILVSFKKLGSLATWDSQNTKNGSQASRPFLIGLLQPLPVEDTRPGAGLGSGELSLCCLLCTHSTPVCPPQVQSRLCSCFLSFLEWPILCKTLSACGLLPGLSSQETQGPVLSKASGQCPRLFYVKPSDV